MLKIHNNNKKKLSYVLKIPFFLILFISLNLNINKNLIL